MSCEAWYAVNTKANSELLAAQQLRNQGIEVYLPRFAKTRKHARKVENILAPLFPRYLFVRLDLSNARWRAVNSTIGVARLVCFGDVPARVLDSVIEEIKKRANENGTIELNSNRYQKGQKVRVATQLIGEFEAIFDDMPSKERVVVLMGFLGRQVRTTVKTQSIHAA